MPYKDKEKQKECSKKYYQNNKEYLKQYAKEIRKLNYCYTRICKKCGNLFFVNFGIEGHIKNCKICRRLKTKSKKESDWFEWEDNLLRNFYYNMEKSKLMELFPLRKTRSAIMHRAKRIGVQRNKKFMRVNDWTTKNNPMNDIKIREIVRKKLIGKPSWNKGIKQWKNKIHPRGMLNKSHSEEVKLQISISMSGEKGPNWLGGKSFEPYNKFFNKRFKRLIKKRDKNKCVICGRREEYNQLSIHHIDYNKLNSIESNCITLCNSCHMKTNYNREFWKNYLSNLINQTIQPINQTL